GGNSLNESLPLDEVFIYDTKNNNWSTKKTSGLIPSNRYDLTAVLGLDGEQVIVYGGLGNNNIIISPKESLYTLNINTFEWSIPKITGNIPSLKVNTLHIPNGKLDNQSGQKTVETTNKVDNHDEEAKQV
ncbi:hypothetical protein RhiirC2_858590, partial [Rhizophagus irregularis]